MISKSNFKFIILLSIGLVLVLTNVCLVYRSIALNRVLKVYESDYSTLNSIKYAYSMNMSGRLRYLKYLLRKLKMHCNPNI